MTTAHINTLRDHLMQTPACATGKTRWNPTAPVLSGR